MISVPLTWLPGQSEEGAKDKLLKKAKDDVRTKDQGQLLSKLHSKFTRVKKKKKSYDILTSAKHLTTTARSTTALNQTT